MIKKYKAGFSVLINYNEENRNIIFSTIVKRWVTWASGNCPPMSSCISFEDIKKNMGKFIGFW